MERHEKDTFDSALTYKKAAIVPISVSLALIIIPLVLALVIIVSGQLHYMGIGILGIIMIPAIIGFLYLIMWYLQVFKAKSKYGFRLIIKDNVMSFIGDKYSKEFKIKSLKSVELKIVSVAFGWGEHTYSGLGVVNSKFNFSDNQTFEMRSDWRTFAKLQNYIEDALVAFGIRYKKEANKSGSKVTFLVVP